jgi:hypothetical protein
MICFFTEGIGCCWWWWGEPNVISASQMDPAWPIWPKIATTKQLDPKNKPVTAFLKFRKINLTRRGQRSTFDLILPRNHVLACRSDPANLMWTKIGTVKQLDTGNKTVMAVFQNLQI